MSDGGAEGLSPAVETTETVIPPAGSTTTPSALPGVNQTDMETESQTERPETEEVSATESAQTSYASAAASEEPELGSEIVDTISVVLKKIDAGVSYYLSHREKAKLVFRQLGIERKYVIGIDQSDYRTIDIHLNVPGNASRLLTPWTSDRASPHFR